MAPIEGNIRRLLPFPAAIVITLARENGLLELEDGTQHYDDLQPFLHRQKSQRQTHAISTRKITTGWYLRIQLLVHCDAAPILTSMLPGHQQLFDLAKRDRS